MNHLELDNVLRTFSPHEINYKKNPTKNDFSKENILIIKNWPVIRLEMLDFNSVTNPLPFIIKKHSRFQDFPLHNHAWIELNYMYSGECSQLINGEVLHLKKGEVLLMNANTTHTIKPLDEDDILINIMIPKTYFSISFFNRFSSDSILTTFFIEAMNQGMIQDHYLHFTSEKGSRLNYFFKELLCEYFDHSFSYRDISENLLSLIISELVNNYHKSYDSSPKNESKQEIIPILRYIETRYLSISLDELAQNFDLNPNYLSNLLKKRTGYSFKQIVINQRLLTADRMLQSSYLSVTEIAQSVGFENINFFYKKFKEHYHMTPGEKRLTYHN